MNQIIDSLQRFSSQLGTGNLMLDLAVLAAIVAGLFFIVALFALGLGKNSEARNPRVDRFDTLLGRLERTERTLHEFRSDVLRALELSRTDSEFLRSELENIRVLMEQEATSFTTRERRPSRDELAVRVRALQGFVPSPVSGSADMPSSSESAGPRSMPAESDEQTTSEQVGVEVNSTSAVETGSQQMQETSGIVGTPGQTQSSLASRLEKTRKGLFERFRGVFARGPKVDTETIDELEAILVGSDLGVKNIREILADVRSDISSGIELSEGGVKAIVKSKLLALLERGTPLSGIPTPRRSEDGPVVILVVGVNGAGKTTSAAKLAGKFKQEGAETLLVAADTFRAAAVEQLHEWGRRLGVPVVSGADNAKPQTVVFDAMQRAMSERVDCVIIDTAGRLHTKQSLMDELSGVRNAIDKHLPGAPHETLLVIDGSTGQNGLNQAREFKAASGVTGLIVTKLDGTSKGGIVVAIKDELGIPVRYIGTGERVEDLEDFSPRDFVEAIFSA